MESTNTRELQAEVEVNAHDPSELETRRATFSIRNFPAARTHRVLQLLRCLPAEFKRFLSQPLHPEQFNDSCDCTVDGMFVRISVVFQAEQEPREKNTKASLQPLPWLVAAQLPRPNVRRYYVALLLVFASLAR